MQNNFLDKVSFWRQLLEIGQNWLYNLECGSNLQTVILKQFLVTIIKIFHFCYFLMK